MGMDYCHCNPILMNVISTSPIICYGKELIELNEYFIMCAIVNWSKCLCEYIFNV